MRRNVGEQIARTGERGASFRDPRRCIEARARDVGFESEVAGSRVELAVEIRREELVALFVGERDGGVGHGARGV